MIIVLPAQCTADGAWLRIRYHRLRSDGSGGSGSRDGGSGGGSI